MFCPKCGGANAENSAFCRGCGEDLKIVSQAMKKNSPVALVSKLDAAIERKNERFRRNAIFMGFFGGTFAIGAIIQALFLTSTSFVQFAFPLMAAMCLLFSAWYMLVYIRSNEVPSASPGATESIDPYFIQPGSESRSDKVFCPACGKRNSISVKFCSSCGQHLIFESKGLAQYLPAFITRKLDKAVLNEKDLEGAYNNRRIVLLLVGLSLFQLVLNAIDGDMDMVLMNVYMLASCIFISGWDYLTYRRSLEKEEKVTMQPPADLDVSEGRPPRLFPDAPTGEFLENPTVPIGDLDGLDRKAPEVVPLRPKSEGSDRIGTAKLSDHPPEK